MIEGLRTHETSLSPRSTSLAGRPAWCSDPYPLCSGVERTCMSTSVLRRRERAHLGGWYRRSARLSVTVEASTERARSHCSAVKKQVHRWDHPGTTRPLVPACPSSRSARHPQSRTRRDVRQRVEVRSGGQVVAEPRSRHPLPPATGHELPSPSEMVGKRAEHCRPAQRHVPLMPTVGHPPRC